MNHPANIKGLLKKEGLDALIVTNPTNIFYLTGFKGVAPTEREAILIAGKSGWSTLITAKLYAAEANKLKTTNLLTKIASERDDYEKFIKEALRNSKTVGFESHDIKFAEYKKFKKYQKEARLKPTKDLVENLREI